MNLHELFLEDFHSATSFEMYAIVISLIMLGIAFGIMMCVKSDIGEFYRRGQIDAINGKIKYKKCENDDKESVWREIPKSK